MSFQDQVRPPRRRFRVRCSPIPKCEQAQWLSRVIFGPSLRNLRNLPLTNAPSRQSAHRSASSRTTAALHGDAAAGVASTEAKPSRTVTPRDAWLVDGVISIVSELVRTIEQPFRSSSARGDFFHWPDVVLATAHLSFSRCRVSPRTACHSASASRVSPSRTRANRRASFHADRSIRKRLDQPQPNRLRWLRTYPQSLLRAPCSHRRTRRKRARVRCCSPCRMVGLSALAATMPTRV
jgi:hypothetical protein